MSAGVGVAIAVAMEGQNISCVGSGLSIDMVRRL